MRRDRAVVLALARAVADFALAADPEGGARRRLRICAPRRRMIGRWRHAPLSSRHRTDPRPGIAGDGKSGHVAAMPDREAKHQISAAIYSPRFWRHLPSGRMFQTPGPDYASSEQVTVDEGFTGGGARPVRITSVDSR